MACVIRCPPPRGTPPPPPGAAPAAAGRRCWMLRFTLQSNKFRTKSSSVPLPEVPFAKKKDTQKANPPPPLPTTMLPPTAPRTRHAAPPPLPPTPPQNHGAGGHCRRSPQNTSAVLWSRPSEGLPLWGGLCPGRWRGRPSRPAPPPPPQTSSPSSQSVSLNGPLAQARASAQPHRVCVQGGGGLWHAAPVALWCGLQCATIGRAQGA